MGRIKDLSSVRKPPGAQIITGAQGVDHIIFTGGDNMTEAAREARRAYKKEWNRKNRDKVREAQTRYWERKAQAMQAAQDQQTDEPTAQEAG